MDLFSGLEWDRGVSTGIRQFVKTIEQKLLPIIVSRVPICSGTPCIIQFSNLSETLISPHNYPIQ